MVDAGELLLDDLGDGVFDHLGIGAGVVGARPDLRRRDVGIGFDGQAGDRQMPASVMRMAMTQAKTG